MPPWSHDRASPDDCSAGAISLIFGVMLAYPLARMTFPAARSSLLRSPRPIWCRIFAFTLAQNEFLYALIFLTDTSVRTVPVGAIAELIRGDVFYWAS